jgi:hypothetical protein
MDDSLQCRRCNRPVYRVRRRWVERILWIPKAYYCNRCGRRRYRGVPESVPERLRHAAAESNLSGTEAAE